MSNIVFLSVN